MCTEDRRHTGLEIKLSVGRLWHVSVQDRAAWQNAYVRGGESTDARGKVLRMKAMQAQMVCLWRPEMLLTARTYVGHTDRQADHGCGLVWRPHERAKQMSLRFAV